MRCPYCDGTGDLTAPTVGALVLASRRKKNMTQLDLSERCGLSRSQIANLETDRTDLSIAALMRVAKALDVRPGELLP